MASLYTPSLNRAVDSNGNPSAGAKLFFYDSETTTPKTYYLDAEEAVPGPHPLEADAYGIFPEAFITGDGEYRVRHTDASEATIFYDADPVVGSSTGSSGGDIYPNGISTAAIQEAIDLANSAISVGRWVVLDSSKTYLITDTIVVGNATAASNIEGIDCRHARLTIQVNGKPVFDMVGVRNGKFQFRNVKINDQGTTYIPECIWACGRPKQASGVKSSGNFVFSGNVVFANCSVAIVRCASSEVNLYDETNIFYNYHPIGYCIAATKSDYFLDTFSMAWDAKAGTAFVPGETLTGPSGTAKILQMVQTFASNTGGALVQVLTGTFADNDALVGSIGAGTANINMPLGVRKNGPLSTTYPLGIEVETTSARQIIRATLNAVNTKATGGTVFISDFTDVEVVGANSNVGHAGLYHVHVQEDKTRFPANSQPPVGFRSQFNYYHSDQLGSVSYGDPATTGALEVENIILGPECNAGSPTTMEARYRHIGKPGQRFRGLRVVSDHIADFRGAELRKHNTFELTDFQYAGLKLDTSSYAMVTAPSECASRVELTMSDATNFVTRFWTDLGMTTLPPFGVTRTIAAGVISTTRPFFRVDTEGAAAADDLTSIDLPTGVPANGITLTIRSVANARVVTLKVATGASARILGPADFVLDNISKTVTLIGESGSGNTAVFRIV